MGTETLNNDVITIGGLQVDTTVKSHDIDKEVLATVRAIIKKSKTKTAAAKSLNVKRDVIDRIYRGTCAPETYIKLLTTLYPAA